MHITQRSIVCILLGFFFGLPFSSLHAQIEFNVKLRTAAPELRSFLQENQTPNLARKALPTPLLDRYRFLGQLQQSQSLRKAQDFSFDNSLANIFTLRFEGDASEQARVLAALQQSGAFEWVEENRVYTLDHLQQDPPQDDSISQQWYHSVIRTFEAWDRTRGSQAIKIGVIDTGLDFGHPEFDGQVFVKPQEDANGNGTFEPWPSDSLRDGVSGDFDGIDQDNNGFIDDVVGYDFADQPRSPFGGDFLFPDPNPADDNDHGTFVAGVIGAKADNGLGGAGIAPNCKLVILRAFASNGNGEDDDVARAIVYAADNGVNVLNLSFGDVFASEVVHEAIKYAYRRGVVMVGSAGNGTGDELHYPSGYSEVISVAATTIDFNTGDEFLWPLSSFGLTVDLAAPGSGIFAPTLRDTLADGTVKEYTRVQGTSLSAPMVAAAIGLLFSHKGVFTPEQTRGILTSTARDLSRPGWDHLTGAGRLNIERMLDFAGVSRVQIVSPENDGGSDQEELAIVGTVLDPEFRFYSLQYQAGTEGTDDWIMLADSQQYQIKADTLAIWDLRDLPEGEYTLRLRLEKSNGFSVEDRIRFVRDTSPPEIEVFNAVSIWDNLARKFFLRYRSSDQGFHTLHYRLKGNATFQQQVLDRTTKNGEFLLGTEALSAGVYEYFIEVKNLAGVGGQTPIQEFSFQPEFLSSQGYDKLPYNLPMGRPLPQAYDIDQDLLQEVVMSRFDESLSLGPIVFYEFNGTSFQAVDSIEEAPILIPKDLADADKDGLMELLVSVNDSNYIYEQSEANAFPDQIIYRNEDQERFSARFADTDSDGDVELLMKDFQDYYVYEPMGNGYQEGAKLEDVSGNYFGSIAPRILVEDFDGDNRTELIYGDFDGDVIIYENNGPGNYNNTFIDSTNLTKSGTYLTAGDFDGDGLEDFFVAVHPSGLRNDDFENNIPFWWLRIFKATGDNRFEVVWEDYLFDKDTDNFNAAIAADFDQDGRDELVFSTFPRTYLVDLQNDSYKIDWYFVGALTTHKLVGDFNQNEIPELGIGRGDSIVFFEKNLQQNAPFTVNSLRGEVRAPNQIALNWTPVGNATSYQILKVQDPFGNPSASIAGPIAETSLIDNQVLPGQTYAYAIISVNPGLSPSEGEVGNFIFLSPHAAPEIDSIEVLTARQISVCFTQPVVERPEDRAKFTLNGDQSPSAITQQGDPGNCLLLSFLEPLAEGNNRLQIDPSFQDAAAALISPTSLNFNFNYQELIEESLYLSRWDAADASEVILSFNLPLDENTALDSLNYTVSPIGKVSNVEWASEDNDVVRLRLEEVSIGALGYTVSITVNNVCAINDVCIGDEGNTATFSSNKADLSEVFAYPNPVRKHSFFEGMRFANLTQQATIRIFSVTGRYITTLEEVDGDGGVQWDLRDRDNHRIKPGIYLFEVSTDQEGVEDFMGKFSVVE